MENLFINLLLLATIAPLILTLIKHKKELKETEELKEVIKAYDRSDKVIKGCIISADLPINITKDNITIMYCYIVHLSNRGFAEEVKNLLGLRRSNI